MRLGGVPRLISSWAESTGGFDDADQCERLKVSVKAGKRALTDW